MLMGVASGAFVIIWKYNGDSEAVLRSALSEEEFAQRSPRFSRTDRPTKRKSQRRPCCRVPRARKERVHPRTMFEQEEKDAGGTEGFDIEDDYEEEALADNEEEGDTG